MRRLFAAALAAAVFVTPMPALAQAGEGPVYNTHYYSDATYTVEVGFDQGLCFYFGPGSGHSGQATDYYQLEYIGYCYHGSLEPL
jgi:hypothetical protein